MACGGGGGAGWIVAIPNREDCQLRNQQPATAMELAPTSTRSHYAIRQLLGECGGATNTDQQQLVRAMRSLELLTTNHQPGGQVELGRGGQSPHRLRQGC